MTAIRLAEPQDVPRLAVALKSLAETMGDPFAATEADLSRALHGPAPICRAQVAGVGKGAFLGAVFYSPIFSTIRGAAGIFVSDLWASEQARGQGLGPRLLAAALRDAAACWGASYLKLHVYDDNPNARRFYDRLGFEQSTGEAEMVLERDACAALVAAQA
ncbi:GNAT family N-acetyltransferase [Albimonas pacifica]|uniref:Ribosomal protein S18 acetylase RimI n=1 Tax=Albimonas pacifica TaxID=1114924 RepID=A0A1I3BJZ2_9RHOB|nr:GNAT family N-acetyltransferase [Albimonas pacifica]SFH62239.1 Ribosomal protein S18 acetylase RimI [Albimonas pacifica]